MDIEPLNEIWRMLELAIDNFLACYGISEVPGDDGDEESIRVGDILWMLALKAFVSASIACRLGETAKCLVDHMWLRKGPCFHCLHHEEDLTLYRGQPCISDSLFALGGWSIKVDQNDLVGLQVADNVFDIRDAVHGASNHPEIGIGQPRTEEFTHCDAKRIGVVHRFH